MLDWLQKLLAGDQSVAPPNAKVKRDAKGRIVEVVQALSLAKDDPDAPAYPTPGEVDGLAARLSAACDWLTNRNIALARDWGIGLERDYSFDQETGRLALKFGRRRTIAAHGQVLGSFDPRDRSFTWSWANPSIRQELCADAARLKAEGERLGVAALTAPVQKVTFDTLLPLLALTARDGGADGVYRCMVNGSTSLFVALRLDGAAPEGAGGSADGLTEAARTLVADYDREMLPIDRDHHWQGKRAELRDFIDRKMEIYQRYWSREDDYWEPCSVGWPSEHDPDTIRLRFTIPHPQGGALDIAIGKNWSQHVYRIEPVDGALRITNKLIEWGDGFVWPVSPGPSLGTP